MDNKGHAVMLDYLLKLGFTRNGTIYTFEISGTRIDIHEETDAICVNGWTSSTFHIFGIRFYKNKNTKITSDYLKTLTLLLIKTQNLK